MASHSLLPNTKIEPTAGEKKLQINNTRCLQVQHQYYKIDLKHCINQESILFVLYMKHSVLLNEYTGANIVNLI